MRVDDQLLYDHSGNYNHGTIIGPFGQKIFRIVVHGLYLPQGSDDNAEGSQVLH